MELLELGPVGWAESQLIYHALADLGREALVLVWPERPYVCLGFQQEPVREVDLDFCRTRGLPLFRREVGGGGVYLDADQIFFQLVLRRDNPLVPASHQAFYRRFLQPAVEAYRRLGLPAEHRPVNDIAVQGRKICGTGAGEIEDCVVFVGNLILDFDHDLMARLLRVPDEAFRARFRRSLEAGLTTLRRELGPGADNWTRPALSRLLAEAFEPLLGPFRRGEIDAALMERVERRREWMLSPAWLHRKGRRTVGREVKVRAGVSLVQRTRPAAGGVLTAVFEDRDGRLVEPALSLEPLDGAADRLRALEKALTGQRLEDLPQVLARVEARHGPVAPGVEVSDWLALLQGKA